LQGFEYIGLKILQIKNNKSCRHASQGAPRREVASRKHCKNTIKIWMPAFAGMTKYFNFNNVPF
jgi:hypothetical protein